MCTKNHFQMSNTNVKTLHSSLLTYSAIKQFNAYLYSPIYLHTMHQHCHIWPLPSQFPFTAFISILFFKSLSFHSLYSSVRSYCVYSDLQEWVKMSPESRVNVWTLSLHLGSWGLVTDSQGHGQPPHMGEEISWPQGPGFPLSWGTTARNMRVIALLIHKHMNFKLDT